MFKKLRRIRRWDESASIAVLTLWFCSRDRRAGFATRWLARLAVYYVYSPIDFIPDFIPVIGHLDDLLIVPAVSRVVRRWTSEAVWTDAGESARRWLGERGNVAPTQVRVAIWTAVLAVALLLSVGVFGLWLLVRVMMMRVD